MKNKDDCNDVLKKNNVLTSKIDFVVKENESLKNEIVFITKELDICVKKNVSLQNNIDAHVCHARVVSHTSPLHVSPLL